MKRDHLNVCLLPFTHKSCCVFFVQIRTELEQHMNCNLKEYKEFIDNEMLLILGQMDKATLIFDHVYLVGKLMLSLTLTETTAFSC